MPIYIFSCNRVRKLTLAATNFPVLEHHQPTSCISNCTTTSSQDPAKQITKSCTERITDSCTLPPSLAPPKKKKIQHGAPFTTKTMIPKNFQWEILKPPAHPSRCSPNKNSPGLLRFLDGSLKAFTEPLLLRSVWQSFGSPSPAEEDVTQENNPDSTNGEGGKKADFIIIP